MVQSYSCGPKKSVSSLPLTDSLRATRWVNLPASTIPLPVALIDNRTGSASISPMFWTMKRGFILIGVLALIVMGGWFGRPIYRGWKEQRSMKQAQAFFASKDYRNATLAARQALAANAGSIEACRLMADIAETLRSTEALNWRQRVVNLQPQNFTNRLRLARTAILQGN